MRDRAPSMEGSFRYKRTWATGGIVGAVLAVSWFFLFLLGEPASAERSSSIGFYFLWFSVPGLVLVGHTLSDRRHSDVVIDESGISWVRGAKVRKKIAWSEVKQVDFGAVPRVFYDQTVPRVSYAVLVKRSGFVRSGIFFDSSIENIRQLLTIINYYATAYSIPIKERRVSAAATVNAIPLRD